MKNKAKALSLSAFVALMLAVFLQATASVCSHDGALAQKAHTGRDTVKLVIGMDGLRKAGPGRAIETCDLSRQGLKGIPSLKAYTILRLNLSGNDFRRRKPGYVVDSLPHSLRELNISNCGIGADLRRGEQCYCKLGRDSFSYLMVLNASGNEFTAMELSPTMLRHVDVSNNRLSILRFSDRYAVLSNGGALGHWGYRKEWTECARTVEYLNISGNRSMYSGIAIAPEKLTPCCTTTVPTAKRYGWAFGLIRIGLTQPACMAICEPHAHAQSRLFSGWGNYVPCFLKYVPCILKLVPSIFSRLWARSRCLAL